MATNFDPWKAIIAEKWGGESSCVMVTSESWNFIISHLFLLFLFHRAAKWLPHSSLSSVDILFNASDSSMVSVVYKRVGTRKRNFIYWSEIHLPTWQKIYPVDRILGRIRFYECSQDIERKKSTLVLGHSVPNQFSSVDRPCQCWQSTDARAAKNSNLSSA